MCTFGKDISKILCLSESTYVAVKLSVCTFLWAFQKTYLDLQYALSHQRRINKFQIASIHQPLYRINHTLGKLISIHRNRVRTSARRARLTRMILLCLLGRLNQAQLDRAFYRSLKRTMSTEYGFPLHMSITTAFGSGTSMKTITFCQKVNLSKRHVE